MERMHIRNDQVMVGSNLKTAKFEDRPRSEMEAMLANLSDDHHLLGVMVTYLEERLAPVTRRQYDSTGSGKEIAQTPIEQAPVVEILDQASTYVKGINSRLQSLLDRLAT